MCAKLMLAALAVAAAHEEGGSSMNAPAANGPELAIEFALADDEVVLHKVLGAEALFACVKLTLHPEEGEQQWARVANVQFPTELPAAAKHWNLASLAAFMLNTNSRFTIKTSPTGASVYGAPPHATPH